MIFLYYIRLYYLKILELIMVGDFDHCPVEFCYDSWINNTYRLFIRAYN
jgi:hypothetical protein